MSVTKFQPATISVSLRSGTLATPVSMTATMTPSPCAAFHVSIMWICCRCHCSLKRGSFGKSLCSVTSSRGGERLVVGVERVLGQPVGELEVGRLDVGVGAQLGEERWPRRRVSTV